MACIKSREILYIASAMAIDWEVFKLQAIKLNEGRTEQERVQSFINSAKTAWKFYGHYRWKYHITQKIGDVRNYTPYSLNRLCAFEIKKRLFIKVYVDLLLQTTDGEGVYPKKWDSESMILRDKVLEIQFASENKIRQMYSQMYQCTLQDKIKE